MTAPLWLADYHEHCAGKRTLVFCASVAQAQEAAQAIGPTARAMSGQTEFSELLAVRTEWLTGKLDAVCGVQVVLDWHPAEAVVVLRPTLSKHLHHHMLYRASSPAGIVLDMVGNVARHGIPEWFKGRVFTNPGVSLE